VGTGVGHGKGNFVRGVVIGLDGVNDKKERIGLEGIKGLEGDHR
jgi:hypothetical protein